MKDQRKRDLAARDWRNKLMKWRVIELLKTAIEKHEDEMQKNNNDTEDKSQLITEEQQCWNWDKL